MFALYVRTVDTTNIDKKKLLVTLKNYYKQSSYLVKNFKLIILVPKRDVICNLLLLKANYF